MANVEKAENVILGGGRDRQACRPAVRHRPQQIHRAGLLRRANSSSSTETDLTHEMQRAVVCNRLPPRRTASVIEYWNTQCARRRSCLSYLCGRSDG